MWNDCLEDSPECQSDYFNDDEDYSPCQRSPHIPTPRPDAAYTQSPRGRSTVRCLLPEFDEECPGSSSSRISTSRAPPALPINLNISIGMPNGRNALPNSIPINLNISGFEQFDDTVTPDGRQETFRETDITLTPMRKCKKQSTKQNSSQKSNCYDCCNLPSRTKSPCNDFNYSSPCDKKNRSSSPRRSSPSRSCSPRKKRSSNNVIDQNVNRTVPCPTKKKSCCADKQKLHRRMNASFSKEGLCDSRTSLHKWSGMGKLNQSSSKGCRTGKCSRRDKSPCSKTPSSYYDQDYSASRYQDYSSQNPFDYVDSSFDSSFDISTSPKKQLQKWGNCSRNLNCANDSSYGPSSFNRSRSRNDSYEFDQSDVYDWDYTPSYDISECPGTSETPSTVIKLSFHKQGQDSRCMKPKRQCSPCSPKITSTPKGSCSRRRPVSPPDVSPICRP